MIYFTADTHFGHGNIIKYCNRPYATRGIMDAELVANWNSVVRPEDIVYHLGDVGLCTPEYLLDILYSLNGQICLIKGNHEKAALSPLCRDRFEWIKDMHTLRNVCVDSEANTKVDIVLCHYAMSVWNKSHHGAWHLFGHSHGTHKGVGLSFDIGVDCHHFYPLSAEQVAITMWKVKVPAIAKGSIWITIPGHEGTLMAWGENEPVPDGFYVVDSAKC